MSDQDKAAPENAANDELLTPENSPSENEHRNTDAVTFSEDDFSGDTTDIDAAALDAAAEDAVLSEDLKNAELNAARKGTDFRAASAANAYSKVQQLKPEDFPAEELGASDKPHAAGAPDYKEIAQRTAAEFDNYRKRVARERKDWQRDVLAGFLKDFLPAFDDLDRTVAESEKSQSVESVCTGVKLARANLWKTLEKAGLKEIEAVKKKFDPRYHEALSLLPAPGVEPNTVIEVFQPGYMIDDFVVRPAKVIVAAEAPKS